MYLRKVIASRIVAVESTAKACINTVTKESSSAFKYDNCTINMWNYLSHMFTEYFSEPYMSISKRSAVHSRIRLAYRNIICNIVVLINQYVWGFIVDKAYSCRIGIS